MQPGETNGDPLHELDTVAEHLAFWNKNQGEAFALELLAMMDQPVPAKPSLLTLEERVKITTRETLEDIARELASAGLKRLAKATRELAMRRPREIDIPEYEPGTVNHRAWLAGKRRRD
jgi:hypothetical protein